MTVNLLELCFDHPDAKDGYIELSSGGLDRRDRIWLPVYRLESYGFGIAMRDQQELYFGPAVRSSPDRMGKANCKGSIVCWVDLDDMETPPDTLGVLMPTAILKSGRGFHAYWKLARFCSSTQALEDANRSLAKALKGDSAHNIDRMLRMTDSWNHKYDPPLQCELIHMEPDYVYTLEQLMLLEKLPRKHIHKILTGDSRGYKSRSERDWAIIRVLVAAGADDTVIKIIFQRNHCGDKYREEGIKGPMYLERTISKVREHTPVGTPDPGGLFSSEGDSYYMMSGRGRKRVSTFTLEPTLLLEGFTDADQDSLVCNVRAAGTDFIWEDAVFPKSAFDSMRALNNRLNKAAWVWLGRDGDVRSLLAFLMARLQEFGIPRARSTNVLGYHTIPTDGRKFFVGNHQVMASDGSYWPKASDAPVMYVDRGREGPVLNFAVGDAEEVELQGILTKIPQLNEEGCIWPMIGWFMACPLKPEIERLGYRFPIHNITGTKGSGKTTLVTRIFQRLLGYSEPRTYDVATTHFVTLTLLGATNAVPIAFSEYRAATGADFTRHVLLAYDTGMDARGNPDQTTTRYPLIAPFSMDGEDKLEDPAALERMIVVVLSPRTITEGSPCWMAYNDVVVLELERVAPHYMRYILSLDVAALLDQAEEDIADAFPMILPDRVRRNLTVAWLGALSYIQFAVQCGADVAPEENARVLYHALENVYSVARGRAPLAADQFIEYVVNGASLGTKRFPWILDRKNTIVWFQLAPAYIGFSASRLHALSRNALRIQLSELAEEYMEEPAVMKIHSRTVLAYGVRIADAQAKGLDIPSTFTDKVIAIRLRE